MTCAISPAAKLWGFCHLHLIIASLETLRLGAVTKKRNKRIILQQKTQLRICSQVSHSKSKPAWEPLFCSHSTSCFADLAHDTVNSCARQKETSVYKMLHVSLDLPIKSMVSFLHKGNKLSLKGHTQMIIQVKVKILGGNCKHYQHTAPPMNQKQAQHRHDHNDTAPFPLFSYRNNISFWNLTNYALTCTQKQNFLNLFLNDS